ncbi:MAG: DUF5050 domain-containing protein [Oscillospiraceae bacterium]|nr:DUF5050 domain-containing protein [Oscillospiraceae bacterium]
MHPKRITAYLAAGMLLASALTACGQDKPEQVFDPAAVNIPTTAAPTAPAETEAPASETTEVPTEAATEAAKEPEELALYHEILRYPDRYPEIWTEACLAQTDLAYLVADLNGDGVYELVINAGELHSTDPYGILTLVKPDGSAYPWKYESLPAFYLNGMVAWRRHNSHISSGYLDIATGEKWEALYYNPQELERELINTTTSEKIVGQSALDMEAQFRTGLHLDIGFTKYYREYISNSGSFGQMHITETPDFDTPAAGERLPWQGANVLSGGFIAGSGTDSVFRSTDGSLCRLDGTCLLEKTVNYLNVQDGVVYLANNTDHCLARMNVQGDGYEVLYEGDVHEVTVYGEWIYFGTSDALYRMKNDGSGCTKLGSGKIWFLNVTEDKLYFTITDNGRALCSCNHDGSGLFTLAEADVYDTLVIGDMIYYSYGADRLLYAMKTDGSGKVQLTSTTARWLNTDGSHLYYTNAAGKTTDGVPYGDTVFRLSLDDALNGAEPEIIAVRDVTGVFLHDGAPVYSDTLFGLHMIF